jgi:hypothetical protein
MIYAHNKPHNAVLWYDYFDFQIRFNKFMFNDYPIYYIGGKYG